MHTLVHTNVYIHHINKLTQTPNNYRERGMGRIESYID